MGGDEFFVLMRNVSSREIVERKAEFLLRKIKKNGEKYAKTIVSGSVGISCFPKDGHTLAELYEKADEALYHAKRNGKNRFVVYDTVPKNP